MGDTAKQRKRKVYRTPTATKVKLDSSSLMLGEAITSKCTQYSCAC